MSTAPKTRKYNDIFTVIRHKYYISLFFLGEFQGNFDNDAEVDEAKREITGY